jgi:hypothetical protein
MADLGIGQLLVNVKEILLDRLGEQDVPSKTHNVQLRDRPEPIATAGPIFISIQLLNWEGADGNNPSLGKGEVSVGLTITQRCRSTPEDRNSDALFVRAFKSLPPLVQTVRGIIHGNPAILADTGLVEPLAWVSCDGPTPQGKEWFSSGDPWDRDTPPAGFSVTLNFRGALEIFRPEC